VICQARNAIVSTPRKTLVFGPAYLDRVVRVDRPLVDPKVGRLIDGSAIGHWDRVDAGTPRIEVRGLPHDNLVIDLPDDWPGPSGLIRLDGAAQGTGTRTVQCLAWHDDLGGMGAGYAKALGGTLCLTLGDESDPINGRVIGLLDEAGIDHRATFVPGRSEEWTLLLTSGEFGDKLPIGFRNPANAVVPEFPRDDDPCDLLVAASMTNRRAAAALSGQPARVRMFAPAMRNMTDPEPKVSSFAKHIDIFCCNRGEWESLDDREEVAWRVSILVVTDGPRGAEVRYTTPMGDVGRLAVPVFPRRHPPRDTNRAGEAFASTLISTILDAGWLPGTTSDGLIRIAAERASASAALVLDRLDFGFPTPAEVDEAVRKGVV
jgi:sugar/nucleoside kinase (ribokinase family)